MRVVKMREDWDGLTGRLAEEAIAPPCTSDCNGCKSYSELIKMIKKSQPLGWNPFDPGTKIANDLHWHIAQALRVDCKEVGLYTTLGIVMDLDGVDLLVEAEAGIVTIDITVNSEKKEYRADFIFNVNNDTDPERLQDFGRKVAEALKSI